MRIPFYKYQGAGNDFIMIDNRDGRFPGAGNRAYIARWCDRHFGIGADGLILLEAADGYHFAMRYYNADGGESTLCGNGGRCIVAFAHQLGLVGEQCRFLAIDGPHEARLRPDGWVELQMQDLAAIAQRPEAGVLNTGSPHYVVFVPDASAVSVVEAGRAVRYSPEFEAQGINVNFVSALPQGGLNVATYERGVEDETLACGTGVTAAALAWAQRHGLQGPQEMPISAKGGRLAVRFVAHPNGQMTNIWLCGPAEKVFRGEVED
jgi:diaminopimelate epimerase